MGKVLRTGPGTEQMMHVLVAYTLCSALELLTAGIYTEATWAAKNEPDPDRGLGLPCAPGTSSLGPWNALPDRSAFVWSETV